METMTVPTTEKQIDELSKRVDFGFAEQSKRIDFGFEQTNQRLGRVEDDVRELRAEINVGSRHVDDQFTVNRAETNAGFGQVKAEFDQVRAEFGRVDEKFARVDERFDKVDEKFDKVDEKFDKVNDEFTAVRAEMKAGFDGMQRLMTRFFAGTLGTIVAAVIVSAVLSHF
jgi:DNA anti-recombination protein RmuC